VAGIFLGGYANMPQKLKESKSKTRRRGNNEGSIYQLKDGSWCGAVTVGYKSDGKLIRKYKYGKTRQEVAKKVAKLTDEVFANGYTNESASTERNFEILCKEWFELCVAGSTLSTTEERSRTLLRIHIYPVFGKYNVQHIDFSMLQRFINGKVKEGLSSDYIGKIKNMINNFFKYAMKQKFVKVNPMLDVAVRRFETDDDDNRKGKALRAEIREDVLIWVMENPILKPIITTFTLTGLRPQELIALKWENVNLDRKIIFVKKALKRVVEFDDDGNVKARGVTIGTTKTKKGVRTIAIPNEVVDALNEWVLYCKEHNINSEFVFPNTTDGKMRTYTGLRSLLTRFVKSHKLENEKITLYTFRHTFATILLERRENPKIVAELMGHVDASTTLDIYSHVVSNDVYEQTARTLDDAWTNITKKKNPTSSLQPAGLSD
jgi:integrase